METAKLSTSLLFNPAGDTTTDDDDPHNRSARNRRSANDPGSSSAANADAAAAGNVSVTLGLSDTSSNNSIPAVLPVIATESVSSNACAVRNSSEISARNSSEFEQSYENTQPNIVNNSSVNNAAAGSNDAVNTSNASTVTPPLPARGVGSMVPPTRPLPSSPPKVR